MVTSISDSSVPINTPSNFFFNSLAGINAVAFDPTGTCVDRRNFVRANIIATATISVPGGFPVGMVVCALPILRASALGAGGDFVFTILFA